MYYSIHVYKQLYSSRLFMIDFSRLAARLSAVYMTLTYDTF